MNWRAGSWLLCSRPGSGQFSSYRLKVTVECSEVARCPWGEVFVTSAERVWRFYPEGTGTGREGVLKLSPQHGPRTSGSEVGAAGKEGGRIVSLSREKGCGL